MYFLWGKLHKQNTNSAANVIFKLIFFSRVIFDYIELKQRRPWFSMHFTNLGFIGKMFRCVKAWLLDVLSYLADVSFTEVKISSI